ncbi:MAG TPA: LamG domain-containing protein [Candidatus Saccharimonadales bacterium]|nr:LamG domain-containing protein [Candidatus Saccharimonadales bacterium]
MQPYNPAQQDNTTWFQKHRKLLLIALPLLALFIAGSTYAAINLTAQNPPEHSALQPGINLAQGEKGLIGWWKLNGNTKDSTPYQNNAVASGSPPASTTDRKGTPNGAYNITASSSINVNNPKLPASAITVSAWIKPDLNNTAGGQRVINNNWVTTNGSWLLYYYGDGHANFGLYDGSQHNATCPAGALQAGQWQLLTGTYDGSTIKLYLNGTLCSITAAASMTLHTTSGIQIANAANSDLYAVSDVRIYNRALSQSDITNLYNSYNSQINLYSAPGGGADIASGLMGEWNFTGNARDATPYSNNGTVSGATLTADRFGNANRAYSFGPNTKIDLADTAALNPTTALTISAWIYPTALANATNYNIFAKQVWGSKLGYRLALFGNTTCANLNCLAIGVGDGTHQTETGTSGVDITGLNQWYMVTGVFAAGTLKLYLNGSLAYTTTTPVTSIAPSGTGADIGAHNPGSEYFAGKIDDVRLYNRALSAADIQALYNLAD